MAGPSVQLEMPCKYLGEIHQQRDRIDGEHQRAGREYQHAERRDARLVADGIDQAPAGTWLAIELTVPTESATPIAVCVQLWPLRYTAMKGPKPVWMLATNRLNQSSPRLAASLDADRAGALVPPPARGGSLLCLAGVCGIGRGRRHEHSRLVESLYSGADCSFCRVHAQDERFVPGVRIEAQQRPIDGDAPGSHAEKAAEIDDRDPHVPSASASTSTTRPRFSPFGLMTSLPRIELSDVPTSPTCASTTASAGGGRGRPRRHRSLRCRHLLGLVVLRPHSCEREGRAAVSSLRPLAGLVGSCGRRRLAAGGASLDRRSRQVRPALPRRRRSAGSRRRRRRCSRRAVTLIPLHR